MAFVATWASSAIAAEGRHPNIVIILADDLGYGSLNSYGADERHIRTPSIDRLAKDGRRFTDANTPSSVCSPTRYGLLTGRYDWRTDQKHGVVNTTDPLHIETSRSTIASLLKSAGYRTAAIGKWHLGYGSERADFTKALSPGPLDLGFDYHFGVPQNHGDASGVFVRNRQVVGLRSDRTVPAGKSPYGRDYLGIDAPQRVDENVMEQLTTDAIDWLEQQRGNTPFFLYFAPVAIHFPYTPSDQSQGKSGTGLYGDWIHELDLSVGRILDTLDRMQAADDTLVIFTSDNGGVLMTEGDRPEADAYRAGLRCNGVWRGRKHSIYEGGFRVPFLVRWPEHVPAATVSSETISLVDMYATIAAVIGHHVPSDEAVAEDSFNVLPAFLGSSTAEALRSSMVVHSPNGNHAIRRGSWKYIEGRPSPSLKRVARRDELHPQLYNLQDDPGEQTNVLNDHPEVAEQLSALLNDQRNSGVTRPGAASDRGAWRDLFNGRDLSGWEANVHPESFTVENGVLKAHGRNGMSHLFFVGDSGRDVAFKDFELLAIVRSEPNSNSGIFFHTDRELRKGKYLHKGYEVQLNSSRQERRKTGSLYGIVDVDKSPVDETRWFEVRLRVEGKRIQVFVEGRPVVDYSEPSDPERQPSRAKRLIDPDGGALAIQAHDPGSVFYFKAIRIREIKRALRRQ
ncbi:MAG: sulfatase-like hydrolase/transferase [Planctomycetota bacterium]|jgi:arylsulfatase A-like enzyme